MRRALLIVFLALCLTGDGQARGRILGLQWTCSVDAINDSATVCASAPEPGQRRYITDIVAQSNGLAGFFALYHGKAAALGGGASCSTSIAVLIPVGAATPRLAAAASTVAPTVLHFNPAIAIPGGRDFCVEGDPGNTITFQVVGYIAP